ncbi:hypothetical protein [Rhizobium sp. GN54]|uniref:hypothetical protein n=1 Tax=Rhizobium sp. GN54 TaxID=2898150 RepID=UPI001E43AA6E|nr:hypothetical protein [Rhizobium sp. GN54]MCD2185413.1 hypothetical protein [Rhizobium sp. GN54]
MAGYFAEHNPRRGLSFIRELRSRCEDLVDNPNGFALVALYEQDGIRRCDDRSEPSCVRGCRNHA